MHVVLFGASAFLDFVGQFAVAAPAKDNQGNVQQQGVRDKARVNRHLATVAETLNEIFNRADREARSTSFIADELAEDGTLNVPLLSRATAGRARLRRSAAG